MSISAAVMYDEEGHETIETVNRRMLGLLQVRVSEQEEWRTRIFSGSDIPRMEQWQSKNHVDDEVPIRSASELSQRVKSLVDAAVGVENGPDAKGANAQQESSTHALDNIKSARSPLHDGVPLTNAWSIRVLEILPGTGDAPLECLLTSVDLNNNPFYEALSYVWGTEDYETPVHVNGTAVSVRKNLYEAVWHLRLENSPRVVWVDSLCINQKDVTEKSSQVALMGDIYRSANSVVVFFGPETQDSRAIFDFLDKNPVFQKDSGYTNAVDECQEMAVAFWNFSQAPWWRRVWVMQEYCLAKKDPILQWGRRSISSSEFTKHVRNLGSNFAIMYVHVQSRLPNAVHFQTAVDYLFRNLTTLLLRPNSSSFWSPKLCSGALLRCGATDPRDRIYAIREIMGPVFRDVFPPDYTISFDGIFTRGTVWLLTMEKFGDVWAYFPLLRNTYQPSWAVDFAHPFEHPLWKVDEFASIEKRASHNRKAEASVFGGTLVVDGLEFDQIHTIVNIDEDDILGLVRALWHFEKVSSNHWHSLDIQDDEVKRFNSLHRYDPDEHASWKPIIEYTSGIDDFPFCYFWDFYTNSGLRQPDWPGFSDVSKMILIQQKCKRTDIGIINILNLIICDFEQLHGLVKQWKEFFPAHAADFDEYLGHALQLHRMLIGANPEGFEKESLQNVPERFHGVFLDELHRETNRLASETENMESNAPEKTKLETGTLYENFIQKMRDIKVQASIAVEAQKEPFFPMGIRSFKKTVESELMRSTMFFTSKCFRGYGVGGTRGFEKGDRVCLLDGVAVPMVLRQVDDKYHRIVGAAHVQGIMEGEALGLAQEGVLKQRSFFIR